MYILIIRFFKKVDETEADVSPYTKEVGKQTDTDSNPETNLKEEM